MAKRLLDVALAAVLVVVTLPIMVVAAVGLAVTFRAWPFFVHDRVGYRGRTFRMVKLRTLPPDAPRYADKYTIGEIPLPWLPRLLRRLHLDELPQLLLVVAGRMSLVGPRPEIASLIPLMPDDLRVSRQPFRPGCTGLWQVSVEADRLIAEAPEYDRFYIRHAGLALDLYILVRTVLLVVSPRWRVALADIPAWAAPAAEREGLVLDLTVTEPAAMVDGPAALLGLGGMAAGSVASIEPAGLR